MLQKFTNNKEVLLRDIRHILKLQRNSISLAVLDDQGCTFTSEKKALETEKQGRIILIGKKIDGLYIIKEATQPKYLLLSEAEKNNELESYDIEDSHTLVRKA